MATLLKLIPKLRLAAGAGLTLLPLVAAAQMNSSSNRLQKPASQSLVSSDRQRVREAYAQLPLSFVANSGQFDSRVRYVAQTSGATFYFTPSEAVFALAAKN